MIDLSDILLANLVSYGAPVFAVTLLLGAIGLPLPTTLLVVAAGAFGKQGYLDSLTLGLVGILGAVTGDSLSFAVGRFARRHIFRRFGNSTVWYKAQDTFQKRGGAAVFTSRFLFTAIATPVNWIAGGSDYSFSRFFLFSATGETIWVAGYGFLGYTFGTQWELVTDFLTDFGGLLAGIVLLGLGIYIYKTIRNNKKKPAG